MVMQDGQRSLVSRVVLRDQVKEALLERILSGQYPAGSRLVETQLAREFGTSQAPVREALRDLEAIHLVQSEPFRGTTVRAVTSEQLAEVYPVRAALEEVAARLATIELDGKVDIFQQELQNMREAARARNITSEIQHDVAFHRRMVEAANNSVLLDVWLSLAIEARTMITFIASSLSPRDLADRHQPILDALLARDPEAAGVAARQHIEELASLSLEARGPSAPQA